MVAGWGIRPVVSQVLDSPDSAGRMQRCWETYYRFAVVVLTPVLCRRYVSPTHRGTAGSCFLAAARSGMTRAVAKIGFTMIPDDIMCRTDLTHLAKCLYGYMCRKARDDRWTGGIRLLASVCGTSHQQVSRAILDLECVKMIQVERGKRGQRSCYRLTKAAHIATLSDDKSGTYCAGVAHIVPEAAHIVPRKRLRPIEKRENTLSLTKAAEKSRDRVPSELHQAVVALFYSPRVPPSQEDYVRRKVVELALLSATPDEVVARHQRWSEVGHDYPCTLATLVRHWGALFPPPPNPYDRWGGKPPSVPPRDED